MHSVRRVRANMCIGCSQGGEIEVEDTVCGTVNCDDRMKVHQIAAKRVKQIIPPEAYLQGCPRSISALMRPANFAAISGRKAVN